MEEVHFIVRKDSLFKKIQDIENAKINDGTYWKWNSYEFNLIYKELFGRDIPTNNSFYYDYNEALKKLLTGDIDVVVMVGGQPFSKLID